MDRQVDRSHQSEAASLSVCSRSLCRLSLSVGRLGYLCAEGGKAKFVAAADLSMLHSASKSDDLTPEQFSHTFEKDELPFLLPSTREASNRLPLITSTICFDL